MVSQMNDMYSGYKGRDQLCARTATELLHVSNDLI